MNWTVNLIAALFYCVFSVHGVGENARNKARGARSYFRGVKQHVICAARHWHIAVVAPHQ